jgi:hypothetical protein
MSAALRFTVPFAARGRGVPGRATSTISLKIRANAGASRFAASTVGLARARPSAQGARGPACTRGAPDLVPERSERCLVRGVYRGGLSELEEHAALVARAAEHDCALDARVREQDAFGRAGDDLFAVCAGTSVWAAEAHVSGARTSHSDHVVRAADASTASVRANRKSKYTDIFHNPGRVGCGTNRSCVAYPRASGMFSTESACVSLVRHCSSNEPSPCGTQRGVMLGCSSMYGQSSGGAVRLYILRAAVSTRARTRARTRRTS